MNTSTRFRSMYAASLALTASVALLDSAPASAHGSPSPASAGDESPEGPEFVPAWQSPTHRPMPAVANEGTGTTSFYTITR